ESRCEILPTHGILEALGRVTPGSVAYKLIPSMLKKTKGTLERKITEAFYTERMQPDLNSNDELQD
ncbi:Hypothetical predicted protein, partial [Paramuricea clavata]